MGTKPYHVPNHKVYAEFSVATMLTGSPYPHLGSRVHGAKVLYVMQSCSRAANRPSGPGFGRTATGKAHVGASPKAVRPKSGRGTPISGPEALLHNIGHTRLPHAQGSKCTERLHSGLLLCVEDAAPGCVRIRGPSRMGAGLREDSLAARQALP